MYIFYPKFLEGERVQNGKHAAPGRQVSTWVHAVKTRGISHVGGSAFLHPSPESGVRPSIHHPPSELVGVHDRPLSGVCFQIPYLDSSSLCMRSLCTLTQSRNQNQEVILCCWLRKPKHPVFFEPCYVVASVCHQFGKARVCVSHGLLWSRSA
jgi:hypothetical protein